MEADPHREWVEKLRGREDWAGLIRYGIAHEHEPAVGRAIEVLRGRKEASPGLVLYWTELIKALEWWRKGWAQPGMVFPAIPLGVFTREEEQTLLVLQREPRASQCLQIAERARGERRQELELAVQAVREWVKLAGGLKDEPLLARGLYLEAMGEAMLGAHGAAEVAFQQARGLYERLSRERPQIYGPCLVQCSAGYKAAVAKAGGSGEEVGLLGGGSESAGRGPEATGESGTRVEDQEGETGGAVRALREKLARLQARDAKDCEAHYHALAAAHYDLGLALLRLEDLAGARDELRAAKLLAQVLCAGGPGTLTAPPGLSGVIMFMVGCQEPYARSSETSTHSCRNETNYRCDLALILTKHGLALLRMKDLAGARDELRAAKLLWQELYVQEPESYRLELAATISSLQSALFGLEDWAGWLDELRAAKPLWQKLYDQDPESHRHALARTLLNLGQFLVRLGDWPGVRDELRAAKPLWQELYAQGSGKYRGELAFLLYRLGLALHKLGDMAGARDELLAADEHYEVLAEALPEVETPLPANVKYFLGVSMLNLGAIDVGLDYILRALSLGRIFRQSDLQRFFGLNSSCWSSLGQAFQADQPLHGWPDYRRARLCFQQGVHYAEQGRALQADLRSRRKVLAQSAEVYWGLIHACVALSRSEAQPRYLLEGIQTLEGLRARSLLDGLIFERIKSASASQDLLGRLSKLLRERERLRLAMDTREATLLYNQMPSSSGKILPAAPLPEEHPPQVFQQLDRECQEALRQVKAQDPGFDLQSAISPISAEQLTPLIPADQPTAFIQWVVGAKVGLALITSREGVVAIDLPELGARHLGLLAQDWWSAYYGSECAVGTPQWMEHWSRRFLSALARVTEAALRPLLAFLESQPFRRLILSPPADLHWFPLHLGRTSDGGYWRDRWEVFYTPSLSIWHLCVQRPRPQPRSLLFVENPTNDLPLAPVESRLVRRHYPQSQVLAGLGVDKEKLLALAREAEVLAYCGHSHYDREDPLSSALILRRRQTNPPLPGWLYLRDVLSRMDLSRNRLTVLGGCESGFMTPEEADDYFSLSTGFLYAGASCVVSTLWPVWDLSGALLLSRFHEVWRRDDRVAEALGQAQDWLRGAGGQGIVSGRVLRERVVPELCAQIQEPELRTILEREAERVSAASPEQPPFADPVHWAGFIASGHACPLR